MPLLAFGYALHCIHSRGIFEKGICGMAPYGALTGQGFKAHEL